MSVKAAALTHLSGVVRRLCSQPPTQEKRMGSIIGVMPVKITGDGRGLWDGTGGACVVAGSE